MSVKMCKKVNYSSQFRDGIKTLNKKNKHRELDRVNKIIDKLRENPYERYSRGHSLNTNRSRVYGCRDIHVGDNIVILYRVVHDDDGMILDLCKLLMSHKSIVNRVFDMGNEKICGEIVQVGKVNVLDII